VAPSDAHRNILTISDFTLSSKGGEGVAREVIEDLFKINPLDILFKDKKRI
jgi:3-deoxy-D-manno-octulosonate 8-phosphate phosphatase KdsC-like HAD superfamily phosphatase